MDIANDLQVVGRVALGAVPALVTIAGLTRGPGAARARLRHDLELLAKIPEGTTARTRFEAYLDEQVERFAKLETEGSRDVSGLAIAIFMAIGFGALTWWFFSLQHWWWYLAGVAVSVVVLALLVIIYDAAQKVPRDDKGNRT